MANKKYKVINECRCCGHKKLIEYLDLKEQPLANSYHKEGEELPTFPLAARLCPKCFHSQLSVVVDPDEMFKHYLYVSGTSQTLRNYFDFFAEWTRDLYFMSNREEPQNVLDIACNDGSQLDSFKKLGLTTYGIDPAMNIVPLAAEKGHFVMMRYWSNETADLYLRKVHTMDDPTPRTQAPFSIITAQNVFAHTHDVAEFLAACKRVMNKRSLLFIQTSQSEMFLRNEFDTMYHEHLSFFNTKSMKTLVERCGLHLEAVQKTEVHGTSYVFIVSVYGDVLPDELRNVDRVLKEEKANGLYDVETYTRFGENAKRCTDAFANQVKLLRFAGFTVIGYGAAAKGMTVLNFGDIHLDYIIDDNPLKQGLLTPGTNIPIYGREKLLTEENSRRVFVPLAWNFFDEIASKINEITGTINPFLQYFPTLQEVVR